MTHGGAVAVGLPCSDLTLRKCPESLERSSHGGLKLTGTDPAILLGMTNAEAKRKMLAVLESCPNYEMAVMGLIAAIETQWAEDSDLPPQLGLLLDSLRSAADLAQELDDAAA